MAASNAKKGHCYLCGQELAKASVSRHLAAKHLIQEEEQLSYLLKIEDENSNYWLFVDIPVSSTLKTLDSFLRKIWLECCGHLSKFYEPGLYLSSVGINKKIGSFPEGFKLMYDYDFGSTTTLKIVFMKKITRPAQRTPVRVLARNDPYSFPCSKCKKEADYVDAGSWPPSFYCEKCARKHETEFLLPVVNSPRMGVCGYTGEFDCYEFNPEDLSSNP